MTTDKALMIMYEVQYSITALSSPNPDFYSQLEHAL